VGCVLVGGHDEFGPDAGQAVRARDRRRGSEGSPPVAVGARARCPSVVAGALEGRQARWPGWRCPVTGDRAIRALTAAVVFAVAAFAAVVSYSHIYALGRAHGQAGTHRSWPGSCSGSASARPWVPTSPMAWRLALSGALISAWPAVAFIGSAEMALSMIRSARCSSPDERTGQRTLVPFVPADALEAASAAFAASVAASNPISQRQMIARFGLTRTQERKARQSVLAESNGHGSGDGSS
jgi:hypothetical protein